MELEDKKNAENKIISSSPFNKFRGDNRSEGKIPADKLERLRQDILALKTEMPDKILPDENFIHGLGNRGFGCVEKADSKIGD